MDLHQFNISGGQSNIIGSDDEFNFSDEEMDLDEIAAIISQGYEDIRASNPNMQSQEDEIDELIGRVLRRNSYRAFEQLMTPFLELKGNDIEVDTLLLTAQFALSVPKIAKNIQSWVSSNLDVSIQHLQNYKESLSIKQKPVSFDALQKNEVKSSTIESVNKLVLLTANIG